ncbi:MAG: alpha/beta hydrolase [Candidatus Hodarchaeota archaeon]
MTIEIREITIPVPGEEGKTIFGKLYISKELEESKQFPVPCVVIGHGGGDQEHGAEGVAPLANMICSMMPFVVFPYDARGWGKSSGPTMEEDPGQCSLNLVNDLPIVLDYLGKLPEIDENRFGYLGASLSSVVALTTAYGDARVKVIVVACGLNDVRQFYLDIEAAQVKDPENPTGQEKILIEAKKNKIFKIVNEGKLDDVMAKISPNNYLKPDKEKNKDILLLHAKDDFAVPFKHFEANVKLLNLPETNYHVFETGGHYFEGHVLEVADIGLEWLDEHLSED